MARVCIQVGPKPSTLFIDALPFLPGLYFHKPPDTAKNEPLYNVTHVGSGLSVLTYVSEKRLELARMILGRVDWEKAAEEIYYDNTYDIVIKEALAVLTDKKAMSDKQEKRIAKDLGGKRQPASGAVWGYRRDVKTPSILVEAKTTSGGKYALSVQDLEHLRVQAYSQGKVPAYIVELGKHGEIVILPSQELGDEELEHFGEIKSPAGRKPKKSFTLTSNHASYVLSGNCLRLDVGGTEYLIMDYEKFLWFAKRDL